MRTHDLLPRLVLGLALAVPLGACEGASRTEHVQIPGEVQRLEVETGAGDVMVYGDDCENVEVWAQIGEHDELQWRLEGGVLRIDGGCGDWLCGVGDVIVTVPYDVEVDVSGGAGDVTVADISASVWVDTGAGDVELHRLGGESLQVATGAGDVGAHALRVDEASFDTGAGDVEASFSSAPGLIVADTGAGDVDVYVPRGDYDLEIDTGAGDVDIDDLGHDSSSPHRIRIDTGAGDVKLRGR